MRDLFGHEVRPAAMKPPRKGGRPSRAYLVALRLDRGQHPHQGDQLGPAGETCGSCAHCIRYRKHGVKVSRTAAAEALLRLGIKAAKEGEHGR